MGQSLRPKKGKTKTEATVRQMISIGGESGTSSNSSPDCFQFQLEEPTQLIEKVDMGTLVFGDFSIERIIIMAQIGALGFVPQNITKKILTIVESKQTSIQGSVIEKTVNGNVVVEICL